MSTVWFLVLTAMLAVYAILDGFDLGVGALLPWICKNEKERLEARESIGPIWNGNEVWLLAAGGAMFVAFPRLYAASFSGFYLALMLVLWLFMGRGIGFEFRHAHPHPLWQGLWDTVFSGSSLLLALLFGVAVGNVLHGVPLDANGEFQGSFAIMLNPFALVGGLLSVATLCLHGAAFLAMKTEGDLQQRVRRVASGCWIATTALAVVLLGSSFLVRPGFAVNYIHAPALFLLPILTVGAIAAIPFLIKNARDSRLFAATSLLILSLLGSAAAGLFPRLLPALGSNSAADLTIYNSASANHSLVTALIMNLVGMPIVLIYTIYIYKIWNGKVQVDH